MKKIKKIILLFSSILCLIVLLSSHQNIKVNAEYSSSTTAKITATCSSKVSWNAAWTDDTVTDDVDEYVTLTKSSSTFICTVTINEFFTNQITITCTNQDDSSLTATTTIDTAGRLSPNGKELGQVGSGWCYQLDDTSLEYDEDDEDSYSLHSSTDYLETTTTSNYMIYLNQFEFGFENDDYFSSSLNLTGDTLNVAGHDLDQTSVGDNNLDCIYTSGLIYNLKKYLYTTVGTISSDISVNSCYLVWADDVEPFTDVSSSSMNGTVLNSFSYLFGYETYEEFIANDNVYNWFSMYGATAAANNDINLFDIEVSANVTYDSNVVQEYIIDYPITGLYYSE